MTNAQCALPLAPAHEQLIGLSEKLMRKRSYDTHCQSVDVDEMEAEIIQKTAEQ